MLVFYWFLLILTVALAFFLLWVLAKSRGIGHGAIVRGTAKARALAERGKHKRALRRLFRVLRANGWDYLKFVRLKETNRQVTIKDAGGFFPRGLRALKVLSDTNLGWVSDGFFLIDEIYEKQGESAKRERLLSDFRSFVEAYGAEMNRGERAAILSRASYRLAGVEYAADNVRTAMHMEITGFLNKIESLYAYGDQAGIKTMLPFQPSKEMRTALAAQGRSAELAIIAPIVERAIVDNGARIDWGRTTRDIDSFLTGRLTQLDRDRDIAVMIYEKVVGKAERADEKKDKVKEREPNDDQGGGPPPVIHL
jgi:hypothetical protein